VTNPSDVVVIGSGIVGCAIAYELARRGASVDVVDDRPVAMGATQASAGVLAPHIEAREGSPLLEMSVRSLALYDEFVSRVSGDGGVSIPYRRTGTIDIALDERDLHALRITAEVLACRGVPALLLDAASVRKEEPQVAESLGALLIDEHGYVGAADLTRALAAAARRCGAQLLEPNRVRRVTPRAGDFVLETDKGTLTSSAVVLAAGSWSSEIAIDGIEARVPVRPVRGQLLALAWRGAPLRRVTWSSRCYLVPWDDGTLLVGATVEEAGFDERTTAAGVRDLLDAVCDLVPRAWSSGFTSARVGLRPATPDDLPIIGESPSVPRLFYATGHYRNGVLLAPLTADLVAEALLNGRVDPVLLAVSPARFGRL
jgi:glycine oxidase